MLFGEPSSLICKQLGTRASFGEAPAWRRPILATTVGVRDGKRSVQDGPYADTKEQLGGFFIIEVPNLDTALEWAARYPAGPHGLVEVRPNISAPPGE